MPDLVARVTSKWQDENDPRQVMSSTGGLTTRTTI